jgi:superfamily I DNA and RNA helicase
LKDQRFTLDFTYPTDDLLGKLRIVHRDLSPKEKRRIEKKKSQLADLLRDLETGELLLGDLDEKTRKKLQKILGGV